MTSQLPTPDRLSAQPEDLPPLRLDVLRHLDLEQPTAPGRPSFLSAASGIARRGDYIYVIGDDELFLGCFRASRHQQPGTLHRIFEGELSDDFHERKAAKPDLEVLTTLPPFRHHPYGALLGLGSGSTTDRDRGFVWALADGGALRDEPRIVDLRPLYDLLRDRMHELNIEGASVMGDRLWLLQRGNSELGENVVAELSLDEVMRSLVEDLRIDAHELAAVRTYDLGELGGVPLTFSDAAPLFREMLVFTASAEGSPSSYEDGSIQGSVVGTIDTAGHVHRLRTIDGRYKVEGVYASVDTGVIDLLMVCDQDDPDSASPLLSATMPVEATIEHEA